MPDPLKPVWQDMQQEAANELLRIQAHYLLARVVAVILPVKADLAIGEADQAVIGNGHPMGVAAEILEHLLGAAKRWLGVNHPLDISYGCQISGKGSGNAKRFERAKEVQAPGVKGVLQLRQKQPAKQPREHAYRQEETRTAGDPALAIGTQAAARNHAMQMRVMLQILAPGMQNGDEADLGTQVPGIDSDGAQSFGGGVKQDVVDGGLVLVRDRGDLLGQREDNVEIADGKEVGPAIFQPLRAYQ